MKKKRGFFITALVLFIAAGAGFAVLILEKDNFVIYYGLNAYRALRSVSAAAVIALGLLTLTAYLFTNRKTDSSEETQPVKAPTLSVKEKLDNSSLRKLLLQASKGKWAGLSEELGVMISQLQQMDTYQERLHTLLQDNDIKALSDTEEVLEQAEQSLCQNVRKFINYMNVFDEKDAEVIRTSAAKTIEKNNEQLSQVRDFVVAVTDFVNQQGSTRQDPDLLNTYKNMILDSLKEEL